MAVQLGRPQARGVHDLDDPFRSLVTEDADGHHLGREPARDLSRESRRDLPGGRREHEADGIGAEGDGEECVVLVGDPADLYEHRDGGLTRRRGGRG